jgi:hypothetical protein
MKDRIIAHLEYKKNYDKMPEVALSQRQWPVIKALFSRCSNLWWTILDEVLNDYVVNVRDDVVGFQHHASCDAQSSANESQITPSSPTSSVTEEAISKRTLKSSYTFPTSMGLKEGVQNSKKRELNMKWSQAFYEVNIFINIICPGIPCSLRP